MTNLVGIFPNDEAVLRLITAERVEQLDEWPVAERRYRSEEAMAMVDAATAQHENKELPSAVTA